MLLLFLLVLTSRRQRRRCRCGTSCAGSCWPTTAIRCRACCGASSAGGWWPTSWRPRRATATWRASSTGCRAAGPTSTASSRRTTRRRSPSGRAGSSKFLPTPPVLRSVTSLSTSQGIHPPIENISRFKFFVID